MIIYALQIIKAPLTIGMPLEINSEVNILMCCLLNNHIFNIETFSKKFNLITNFHTITLNDFS